MVVDIFEKVVINNVTVSIIEVYAIVVIRCIVATQSVIAGGRAKVKSVAVARGIVTTKVIADGREHRDAIVVVQGAIVVQIIVSGKVQRDAFIAVPVCIVAAQHVVV